MNNINSFTERLVKRLGDYYGSEYSVSESEINKNNGTVRHAVVIRKTGENIAPSIYIDEFYERYSEGMLFSEIIADIISIRDMHACKSEFDTSLFGNYENIREKLRIKLVNRGCNKLILEDCPHVPYVDMEIVFLITVEDNTFGCGSILIHNDLFNRWNISVEKLAYDAKENSIKKYAPHMMDIFDVLAEIYEKNNRKFDCDNDEEMQGIIENTHILNSDVNKIQVLSSRDRLYGAAVITYPDMLKKIGDSLQCDYYVLPSSIH